MDLLFPLYHDAQGGSQGARDQSAYPSKYSDQLGLTVYRNWNRWRYYSRHEIMQLKREAAEESIQEIMKRREREGKKRSI